VKNIIKKILIGESKVTEYKTVTTSVIKERVLLQLKHTEIDVSASHWVICLQPIIFAVWLNDREIKSTEDLQLIFSLSGNKISAAIVELKYVEVIKLEGGNLYLLQANKTSIKHINSLVAHWLYRKNYKKPQWPYENYQSLIAAYSYPRKVHLVAYEEENYFNIFPMDLLGPIPQTDYFVFGLRHTNSALKKIIASGKVVVSEIPYQCKSIIYELGKHHSSAPPSISALPFPVLTTDHFNFHIPEWAENYREVSIIKTIDLGSHMFMIGKTLYQKELSQGATSLYHIHFLQFLYSKKAGINYQSV
jgi:hypothetical protein